MDWRELISVRITETYGFSIEVGAILLALMPICCLLYFCFRSRLALWHVVQADIRLGEIGNISIRPSYDDIQIAHKAWVELVTRKAALPFDKEHDVICEVYNSWYALFQEMRLLAKSIPAQKIRKSKDTQQLVRLLVVALNDGLRPHLTQWQARFRSWYDDAIRLNPGKSPQEVQQDFPQFSELADDLLKVNRQLVEYADILRRIAHGGEAKRWRT